MTSRQACSFDGCDRRAAGRYCSGHAVQKRQGKPLTPLRERGTGPARCALEGCPQQSHVKGYCSEHARQLERGEELHLTSVEAPSTCCFPGCDRPKYGKKDICTAHYQQRRKNQELRPLYGHLIEADAICKALEGCQHPVYSSEFCRGHYEQRKAGRPFTVLRPPVSRDRLCAFSKCGRQTEPNEVLCRSHLLMQLRTEELGPLKLQTSAMEAQILIQRGAYWCTVCQQERPIASFTMDGERNAPRARCKLCMGIELRAKKFQRSFIDIYRLFVFQNFQCATCPTMHDDEIGLHLDHDHACCPEKGQSCGECIRGLLCFGCNGAVISWYERVRLVGERYAPLEEYLNNPPAARLSLVGR
jgi:hypothetical protein